MSTDLWFAIAAGALIIVIALLILSLKQRLSGATGGFELTAEDILTALTPYLYRAILAGERAVMWGLKQIDAEIESADKKAVADSVYSLLPDMIVVHNIPVPIATVKVLIPRDEFERWVKDAYDGADAFIKKNENYLKSQIDALHPT